MAECAELYMFEWLTRGLQSNANQPMEAEVIELPLFPLNVVLFPGQTLPLHIFEPRYRLMIQKCIDEKSPFGVVLLNEGDGEPYSVGTYADITDVEHLADGRLNINIVGIERFIVEDVHMTDEGYLLGEAILFPFRNDLKPGKELRRDVITQLKKYLGLLSNVSGVRFKFDRFPRESAGIAVFVAIALQLPLDDKQELLATESVSELLRKESKILKDELFTLGIMSKTIRPPLDTEDSIFSLN